MELVGLIGLSDQLADDVHETINFFKDIDSKIWLISGDSKNNTINTAKISKIVDIEQ